MITYMKNISYAVMGVIAGLAIFVASPAKTVYADEYTVTDVSAVYYTNENTEILADADSSTVVISTVDKDLPIQVTGVTSNGYYRVVIAEQTYYIAGIGLSSESSMDAIYDYVYNVLISQKEVFPEGMPWTNETNFYEWNGGIFSGGYGCAAFAFYLSDLAFGDSPARIHRDYDDIKVGDIIRVYNDTHSAIVLEVRPNSVILAEGNYNSSVHWGREMSKSEIIDDESYIMTRY